MIKGACFMRIGIQKAPLGMIFKPITMMIASCPRLLMNIIRKLQLISEFIKGSNILRFPRQMEVWLG
jgi:hypothetical protein